MYLFQPAAIIQYLLEQNESESLQKFYDSVARRSADIVSSEGRQTLIVELYDRFFQSAFPLTTQRLGIVYTPVEVVDFIIHSTNDIFQCPTMLLEQHQIRPCECEVCRCETLLLCCGQKFNRWN